MALTALAVTHAAQRASPANGGKAGQDQAFSKARAANGRRQAAVGRYKITAHEENRDIQCGFEFEDIWNALVATDGRGRAAPLIFNGSHFCSEFTPAAS
jgi:hypothetical protein